MKSNVEVFMELESKGNRDLSFLTNVIWTQHSKRMRKIRGLLNLVNAGHECRTAQFSTDVLVIDGRRFDWLVLESPVLVDRWMNSAPKA